MARMLRFADSADKHLDATRRHMRLCNQITGAQKYAQAIQPQFTALEEKDAQYQQAVDDRTDAYDDMILRDRELDNAVRTAFEKCRQYDRENPNDPVLQVIFPHETFGELIRKNLFKEPNSIEQLAVKFEGLGPKHKLFPLASYLRKYIACMRKSVRAFREALRKEKVAQAQEEMAKSELRTHYEANYLDARKDVGRVHADSLFPRLTHKPVIPVVDEPEEESVEAA